MRGFKVEWIEETWYDSPVVPAIDDMQTHTDFSLAVS